MRKQTAVLLLLMLIFAGAGSSALAQRSSARSSQSAAVRQEKRLGPKPTPRWYWHWVEWRLGEGYAKGHRLASGLRPSRAPSRIRRWGWLRLHFFLLARGTGGGPVSHGGSAPEVGAFDGLLAIVRAFTRIDGSAAVDLLVVT